VLDQSVMVAADAHPVARIVRATPSLVRSLAVPSPSVAGVSTVIAAITLRKAEPAPNDHRVASRTP
jgi:hypothetical protein